jgi:aromatic ring-opening dioxygenase catalytic subunit (LigB family)
MSKDDSDKGEGLSRRGALAAAAITSVAAVTGVAAASGSSAPQASPLAGVNTTRSGANMHKSTGSPTKMPVIFLPHGGGPWPWMDLAFGTQREKDEMLAYLQGLPASLAVAPRAIVVISAHWEEPVVTVMNGERPPLLFDYSGFPPETYRLTWAAPGQPALAQRVLALLGTAGIATATNSTRGFDHGTFVPLKLAWPAGDVPVVQVSLKRGLDPAEHLAMGRALAPLRDEGVLIVGSGMTYHNMRGFFSGGAQQASEEFDRWLREATAAEPAERDRMLREWDRAPYARAVHPREEHLIPLMVVAGAAGPDRARVPYNGTLSNLRLSAHHFG